jgi:hypothetical protein
LACPLAARKFLRRYLDEKEPTLKNLAKVEQRRWYVDTTPKPWETVLSFNVP